MSAKEVPVTLVTGLIIEISALAYEMNNERVKRYSDLYQCNIMIVMVIGFRLMYTHNSTHTKGLCLPGVCMIQE